MRVYWYWPYLRPEHLPLLDATAAATGTLVAHTIPGRIEPAEQMRGAALIDATLPDLADAREHSLRWLASRTTAYPLRARARDRRARQGFDVAHVVFLNYLTDWRRMQRLGRQVALVSTVHDAVPHQRRVPRLLERAMLQRTYAHAGELIVHHASVGARLVDEFDVDPTRIHDIAHWVLPYPAAPKAAPGTPPTVLFFGTLRRNKGVEVLLDAVEELRGLELRVVIAGTGAPEIEAAVRDAARRDRRIVPEIGYVAVERKHELFRECDLVVLPYTQFASQSGVLHDAYAHRRPVVVTDAGALGATVTADGTGWVVAPGSAAALADGINGALADHPAWQRAASACSDLCTDRSVAATAAKLHAVYRLATRT